MPRSVQRGEADGRERLVDLEEVQTLDVEVRLFCRRRMACRRLVRSEASGAGDLAVTDEFAQGREAELFATLGRHDQDRRAAVGDLGGFAGGDRAVLLEGTRNWDSDSAVVSPNAFVDRIHDRITLALGTATATISSANLCQPRSRRGELMAARENSS